MAREHARILCSVWQPGDDFRQRSADAQRLYFLIISQREINNAGVIPVMVSKWARLSSTTTVADIEKALDELEQHRYVIVDRDTEELLVRTFLRGDNVIRQPNILKSALRLARQIESQKLRVALARELARIPSREAFDTAAEITPAVVKRGDENPSVNPSPNPSENSSAQPETNPSRNPSEPVDNNPSPNPSPSPAGRGGVGGRGSVPSLGTSVGGTRERATEPPAPLPRLDPDNPRCGEHRDFPATDRGPNCRACAAVRRELERAVAQVAAEESVGRRSSADDCPDCDEHGWLLDEAGLPVEPARHCAHPSLVGAAS